jgi:phosphoribosylanthranilate isomerase
MTWIKICGITNLQDAKLAVEAGADALGFVFYEKSPRKVSREAAREIVSELPEKIEKVGVFVAPPLDLADLYNSVRLTAVQQHLGFGDPTGVSKETAVGLGSFWKPPKFITSLRMGLVSEGDTLQGLIRSFEHWGEGMSEEAKSHMPSGLFDTFLLDSGTKTEVGGTGKTFDWKRAALLVETMKKNVKVVVAGGLSPENVGEAIRTLHPWGVDVASGTEAIPGKKDPAKVRAFVDAVKAADRAA